MEEDGEETGQYNKVSCLYLTGSKASAILQDIGLEICNGFEYNSQNMTGLSDPTIDPTIGINNTTSLLS